MREFKAEITLNEQESLVDLLTAEKNLVKLYATALTESVTKGVRTALKLRLKEVIEEQALIFYELTERGYMRVEGAKEEQKISVKVAYSTAKKEITA